MKAVQLVAYGGDTLTTLGNAKLEVHLPSMSRNLEFHVINKPVTPFLCLRLFKLESYSVAQGGP